MYHGKNSTSKTRQHKKSALRVTLMSVAICVMIFSVIGGSLAWLMAKTDSIVNVFTYGNIEITLTETMGEELSDGRYFKMTPGQDIAKDPLLTVMAGSEDCWLFIQIEESANKPLSDYIEYSLAEGWTQLSGVTGVYYREVDNAATNQEFYVLTDNTVSVKDSVTIEMLKALDSTDYPKLTFTGYAVQRDMSIDAIDTAAEAWTLVNGL